MADPCLIMSKVNIIDTLKWDTGILRDLLAEAMVFDPQEVIGHSLRRSGYKGLVRRRIPLKLI